jgi:1-acyl-sn-glycerol-3-phosphate acyltransferase
MKRLRSIGFLICWGVWTCVAGMLGLPCMLSRRATWWLTDRWIDGTLWLLRRVCGVGVALQGALPATPCIVASAHQSTLDTLLLWRRLPRPIFILKRELYWIPIFGWYLWRSGQIAINRRAKKKPMVQVLERIERAFAQGRSLVIFPEGTRMPPDRFKPYHRGVAMISAATQKPVQPVALNTGHYWPKRTILKTPGVATFRLLPPVMPCHAGHESEWLAMLQDSISAAQASLPLGYRPGNQMPE